MIKIYANLANEMLIFSFNGQRKEAENGYRRD